MFVKQVIRPTGLVDPICIVKPAKNQIDDLLKKQNVIKNNEILVTTLTKKMAENIKILKDNVKLNIWHSDIDTVERRKL